MTCRIHFNLTRKLVLMTHNIHDDETKKKIFKYEDSQTRVCDDIIIRHAPGQEAHIGEIIAPYGEILCLHNSNQFATPDKNKKSLFVFKKDSPTFEFLYITITTEYSGIEIYVTSDINFVTQLINQFSIDAMVNPI